LAHDANDIGFTCQNEAYVRTYGTHFVLGAT
jgi:hypothetical protein